MTCVIEKYNTFRKVIEKLSVIKKYNTFRESEDAQCHCTPSPSHPPPTPKLRHEFEGGESMYWKLEGQYGKCTKI